MSAVIGHSDDQYDPQAVLVAVVAVGLWAQTHAHIDTCTRGKGKVRTDTNTWNGRSQWHTRVDKALCVEPLVIHQWQLINQSMDGDIQ
ncbi:hypothetical protein QE152_g35703 [Popillia japonica]|uniref:Uncharacterized protein n=1 Tax=Popillia japonica TaxID=7064 RepID=A0AAW1IEQ6_POPJA